MVHFQIDPHSGLPIYRQVMDQVRYLRLSGALKPGDRLPSIRELSKRLAVNPTTIVKAYTELAHADVVERRQGLGVFLLEAPAEESTLEKTSAQDQALTLAAEQFVREAIRLAASPDQAKNAIEETFRRMEEEQE